MTTPQHIVLQLLRLAFGQSRDSGVSAEAGFGSLTPSDWTEVMDFAFEQGVAGIAFEGGSLAKAKQPDLKNLIEWYGQVEYLKKDYGMHREVIAKLASFYESCGLRMMLLKGYGLSQYWPVREHRPVGDVDVYLFGDWKRADRLVREKLGIEVDNGHHHHSVFGYEGVVVENHYDLINTKDHPSSKVFERRLKQLARVEDSKEDGELGICFIRRLILMRCFC